jgi:hypothetical protein
MKQGATIGRGISGGDVRDRRSRETCGWPRRVVAAAMLLAVVYGLNIHLVVVQIYGWSGMMIDLRSTSESWSEAAAKTLRGETPCGVCLQVETAIVASEAAIPAATARAEISYLPFLVVLPGEAPALIPVPKRMLAPLGAEKLSLAQVPFAPTAPPPRAFNA